MRYMNQSNISIELITLNNKFGKPEFRLNLKKPKHFPGQASSLMNILGCAKLSITHYFTRTDKQILKQKT